MSLSEILERNLHRKREYKAFRKPTETQAANRISIGEKPKSFRLPGDRPKYITKRQLEVAILISEGFVGKQIAEKLGITHKTVVKHRGLFMASTDCQGIADTVRWCVANGHIKILKASEEVTNLMFPNFPTRYYNCNKANLDILTLIT